MSDAKAAGPSARWPDPSTAREVRQRMSGAPGGSQIVVEGGVVGDVVGGDKHEVHHHHDPRPHVDAAALGIGRSTTELVGRDEEIEAIVSALRGAGGEARGEAAGVPIHGVRGMGGLGKTALAREAAWRLRDRWPIQHLIDLRGAPGTSGGFGTPGPLTWQSAMRQIVQHLRPTERLPDADADGQDSALRAIYAGELSRRPMLLVLDNALDASQVAPLLPPHGSPSAVIVTSRHSFTLPGGIVMRELGLLEPKAAAQLARVHAARLTEDQATRLAVDLCGRLPLAIEIVARAVAIEELEPVESMLDGLAKARVATIERLRGRAGANDLASVDAAIAWAFDRLPDDEARERFLDLAIFPASFGPERAALLWEVAEGKARCTIQCLRRMHLILVADHGSRPSSSNDHADTGRFAIHDLVQQWCREYDFGLCRLPPGGVRETMQRAAKIIQLLMSPRVWRAMRRRSRGMVRLFSIHVELLERANREAGAAVSSAKAVRELESERKSIEMFFDELCRTCSRSPRTPATESAARRHHRWMDFDCIVELHKRSLPVLRHVQHPADRSRWLEGYIGAARAVATEAKRWVRAGQDDPPIVNRCRQHEASGLLELGDICMRGDDPVGAERCYLQSIRISGAGGHPNEYAAGLMKMGLVRLRTGDDAGGLDWYAKAVKARLHWYHPALAQAVFHRLGADHFLHGEWVRAVRRFAQARSVSQELGDRRQEGIALANIGLVHHAQGMSASAAMCIEEAVVLLSQCGARDLLAGLLGSLANLRWSLGEREKAIECHEQRLAMAREVGDRSEEGTALGELGIAHADLGDAQRAIEHLEQAVVIVRDVGHPALDQFEAALAALVVREPKP